MDWRRPNWLHPGINESESGEERRPKALNSRLFMTGRWPGGPPRLFKLGFGDSEKSNRLNCSHCGL
jgi:hypothetical protein